MSDACAVYVVDDDAAIRESLTALLEANDYVVSAFADGPSFLAAAPDLTRGCVLMDVRMAPMDGLTALARLAAIRSDLPVIVMTGHADVPLAVRAMRGGAVNFLEKPFGAAALIECVTEAQAVSRTLSRTQASSESARELVARLTQREAEVFGALVEGRSNKQAGLDLGISPRTVEVHRARIMEKLEVNSLAEAVRIALAAGLTDMTG